MLIRNKHAGLNLFSKDFLEIQYVEPFEELQVPAIYLTCAQSYVDQDLMEIVLGSKTESIETENKPSLKSVVFGLLDEMDKVNFTPEGNLKLIAVRKKFGGEVTREELDAVIDEFNSLYPERTV